jgi:hypothetical protein
VSLVEEYLELGLRLGRHIDGLVDAYYGPPEIAERVQAEELLHPANLASDAGGLIEQVEPASWLHSQLVGLETVALRLYGAELSYADEVERCYGIRPRWTPEEAFEEAHRELDEALPGSGSVAERYQAWREGNSISADHLAAVISAMVADFRSRTKELFGLPDGESFEVEYVTDEPWAAFNYYLGGLRSRIAVNTDTAMSPDFVAELAAHEAYPGHHTEHVWKEQLLVRHRGDLTESIFLVGTPQALVTEGIAGLALEILLGEEEEEVTAGHVASAGVEYDPEVSRAVKQARRPLEGVGGNAAMLVHDEGASHEEARDYFVRWGLSSPRRAEQSVKFITDPTWRAYVTTYADGYRVCSDYVNGDPRRFRQLLTEQLSPADLV